MQRTFDAILAELPGLMKSRQLCSVSGQVSYLLAVSGGADSMCMADLFLHATSEVPFAIAHCNFSLRGDESDADEALVSSWAEKAGIRLHKTRFSTEEYASSHGLSIEMAARELRYSWFASLCREFGYTAVSVAHNANDNVETLFLNLLRGTGVRGLSGMGTVSPLPYSSVSGQEVALVRPLLDFTRKQIEGYDFAHGIAYRDDRTNFETEYKRNKLRNLVFPLFEQINPSFVRTVNRDMHYFAQVWNIADSYADSIIPGILVEDREEGSFRISIEALESSGNMEYLLYRILERFGFTPSVTASVSSLLRSCRTVPGKTFMSDSYKLVTASGYLVLRPYAGHGHRGACSSHPGRALPLSGFRTLKADDAVMEIRGPGNYFFNGVSFTVSVLPHTPGMSVRMPEGTVAFDRSAMEFPFVCRRWEKGDWMRPLGMKGRKKKVSDIFTDLKYSLVDKESAIMAVNCREETDGESLSRTGVPAGRHVSAILGVRIDEGVKVTDSTSEIIVMTIKDNN